MTDQVNPMSSLPSGLPAALLATAATKPSLAKDRPARSGDGPGSSRPAAAASQMAEAAMAQVNDHLKQTGSELKFQVDEGSGRTFFKIVSEGTGEVLLQVPSEEMLALARNLRALDKKMGASGVLMDKEG